MLNHIIKQINKSKLQIKPFPYFVVKNLIPKKDLKEINKLLPNYKDIKEKDIYFQSASQTKKTLLPSSSRYKSLNKNKHFRKINKIFEQ